MAEPFSVSAHTSAKNIEVWAQAQGSNTKIASKVGQDGQTVLYAKKMGLFEAVFHRTTKDERVATARTLVDQALKSDPPAFKPIRGVGVHQQLLQQAKFSDLPESLRTSPKFKQACVDLNSAFRSWKTDDVKKAGYGMAKLMIEALRNQPPSIQMKFALYSSETLAKELLPGIVDTAKEHLKETGGDPESVISPHWEQLGARGETFVNFIDLVMTNLSDRQVSDDRIVVDGAVYKRDPAPLGGGAFGETYVYRPVNPKLLLKDHPRSLVMKTPTQPNAVFKYSDREWKVNGPLREARALVNASGTGGAEFGDNVAKFHTAFLGKDGKARIVLRLEEGGSAKRVFKKALKELNSTKSDKKVTEDSYEKMSVSLFKDIAKGAMRHHEGGGVAHSDLKIDNLLVSGKGVGRLADPGNLRGIGDNNPLDSPPGVIQAVPYPYVPPDKILGGATTASFDVFMLGITLYEMMSKQGPTHLMNHPQDHPLFSDTDRARLATDPNADLHVELTEKQKEFGLNPSRVLLPSGSVPPNSLLEKYRDLINHMTAPNISKRATLEDVLAHPLMNQPGIETDEIRNLIADLVSPKPQANATAAPVQNAPPQVVQNPPTTQATINPYATSQGVTSASLFDESEFTIDDDFSIDESDESIDEADDSSIDDSIDSSFEDSIDSSTIANSPNSADEPNPLNVKNRDGFSGFV